MRGEIAVGFHGGGSCCRTIPDIGGVRWYLSETRRYIGESVIAFIGERCRSGWAFSTDPSSGVRGGERIGERAIHRCGFVVQ